MTAKTVAGITYTIGDTVNYDSPHGWRKGTVHGFKGAKMIIRVEDNTVLQHIALKDVRPTAPADEATDVKKLRDIPRPLVDEAINRATVKQRARGALVGLLVGDAHGSQVEFKSSEEITRLFPDGIEAIDGSHVWGTSAGQPTDDGELALSLGHAIIAERGYSRGVTKEWYHRWYDSHPFDIGNTTSQALSSRDRGRKPNATSQANGSLMRMITLAILGGEDAASLAETDSAITHPNQVCVVACGAYVEAARVAIETGDRLMAFNAGYLYAINRNGYVFNAIQAAVTVPPLVSDFSGPKSGWVLIALQAAFYHLLHTEDFRLALRHTVESGGDTDTNGAIVGGMMGALLGLDAIPEQWRTAVLGCCPRESSPRPRPMTYWTNQALGLADAIHRINHNQ